ncbi:MAG TPA: hypothetical protein VH134_06565 [Candidatus Dormibacteraeota bacterium]|nr:hypothetical protein [Candidatus Dormibacteraeota bacterium]
MRRLMTSLAAGAVVTGTTLALGATGAHAFTKPPDCSGPGVHGTAAGRASSVVRFTPPASASGSCVDLEGTGNVAQLTNDLFVGVTFNGSGNIANITNGFIDQYWINGSGNTLSSSGVTDTDVVILGSGNVIQMLGSSNDFIDIVGSGNVVRILPSFSGKGTVTNPIVISGTGQVFTCFTVGSVSSC